MDFIFGAIETEKTTCLLELGNKFILENHIKQSNGYILLFTPPCINNNDNNEEKININNKENTNLKKIKHHRNHKDYKFKQYLTRYMPKANENMELIKAYELHSASYAFGLIDNFILLSSKSKGIKLILIDDITCIINLWFNEIIKKKVNSVKNDEKKNIEEQKNILFIYNEIFQKFLSKVISLQKSFHAQCFITLNINISEHINFTKYSPKILNAIFPYIRTSYYLSKLPNDDKIIFNESKLILNTRNEKTEFIIIDEEKGGNNEKNLDENDIDYILLKEFIEKKKKKNRKLKNASKLEEVDDWMKNAIGEFINNINKYKVFMKKMEEQNKQEEDSSSI